MRFFSRTTKVFYHFIGCLLLLNTLITYGVWLLGSVLDCSGSQLDFSCNNLDEPLEAVMEAFGGWMMLNLIFRFMGGIGFILDFMALIYLVSIFPGLFGTKRDF